MIVFKVIALVVIIAAGMMTMIRGGDDMADSFEDPWQDTSGNSDEKDLGALVMGIYKGLYSRLKLLLFFIKYM